MKSWRFIILSLLAACTPRIEAAGPALAPPALESDALAMPDGARLPLRRWFPQEPPFAVVLALHGFNDYSKAFEGPASWLAARGVAVYAYDQRGFGQAPHPGLWAGTGTLTGDLRQAARLIRGRHPSLPFFILGDSMGGAVTLAALASSDPPACQAAILVAPAVWGRATMIWLQRAGLWLAAHTLPSATASGRGLNRKPSDNIEMLRALGRDPLVIKETRIDAIHGLTDLMDEALASAPLQKAPLLLLYGAKEEIIPNEATQLFLKGLPHPDRQQARFYENGYHMLLRDLNPEQPLLDILDYLASKSILGSTR
ncbi:MAG: alpha/beta hydrolase [Rhodospirillales bacterium]|nr:MAG: alpha/beta hydrolase [Rhodospirillales bacterium]